MSVPVADAVARQLLPGHREHVIGAATRPAWLAYFWAAAAWFAAAASARLDTPSLASTAET